MGKLRPFVRKDSYMPNKKWIPFVIGNGYTTTDGASGPAPEYETVTGNPVSFNAITPFPLRQLSVAFSPVQNLNGYDSPWPAGGGVNKANFVDGKGLTIDGTIDTTTSRTTTVDAIPIKADTSYYIHFKETVSGSNANYRAILAVYTAGNMSLRTSGIRSGDLLNTSGGDEFRVCIYDNAGSQTASISVNEPMVTTSATAPQFYSPYSNLCPISGWDSLTVEQRGKNLFSGEKLANASISASGTLENNNSNDVLIARVFEGETYTFSLNPSGVTVGGLFTDYPTMDSVTYNNARLYLSGSESYTYTIPQGVKYIGVRYLKTFTEYQIVLGSTLPTEYVPYNPLSRSISISLGETVYSGTVDVISGVVTVTHKSVDMGTGGWSSAGAAGSTSWKPSDINAYGGSASALPHILCDTAKAVSVLDFNGSVGADGWFVTANANSVIYLMSPQLANMGYAQIKTVLSGRQLVYELATPIPIQLTPQEVQSLAGDNTMWTDGDSLTVEYRSN